jgi:hypothetical protein
MEALLALSGAEHRMHAEPIGKRKGADQRRLDQKNSISCGCLVCNLFWFYGNVSSVPRAAGRPVCEWLDFRRMHRASASGITRHPKQPETRWDN